MYAEKTQIYNQRIQNRHGIEEGRELRREADL